MKQVPTVFKFAGYDYDKQLLTNIFGSESTADKRSVKKLRDDLTHSCNKRAVEELTNRKDELFGYMNEFLEKIRNYDNPQ